ncbi:tripartite tricarboxylate transporter substrate binding protein [Acuticoccus sp. MNP-M23]|uniref:Bug family tripartite tricarboxylate transporter substrate binding protein n=1 Tax=Acuticoccus sp. MNP-M23 TaxID=3072793 RepID=UPI0028156D70|nr:tripartite tricarboxylate transporter substrate binding protein [Acuticoccus sp. MNP-M23]WMS43539.1 tripartite tricarboxylate transporter substrate binding protein [Acuticoccus sp. MNP-M23]
MTTRRTLLGRAAALTIAGAVACVATLSAPAAQAEEAWPTKPVRVIVPFKPGGRTDTVARLAAKVIEEKDLLGQPLIIVNMPGGGGAIAGQAVLDSDDNHTIAHWHHQMLIANAMGVIQFGPENFKSIGFTGGGSPVWVVRSDAGIDSLETLVTKLKAEPNSMVEVIGIGSIPHFVGALLADKAGFETRKVQANSGADRLKMIAGNNADIALFAASEYLNMKDVGSGLDALVFFGPNRIDNIKDVPTAKELGYDVTWANPNWWLAPASMPDENVEKLATALKTAMEDESVQTYFAQNALDLYWTDGADAQAQSDALLTELQAVAKDIR